ncbi:MAG TPA: NAD(P)H-binding protein [bacterium]|nr:NAD(P)H-binding protein [bacterium]
MFVFVAGATGRTGRALVQQGLARGHVITAFGRSAFNAPSSKLLRVLIGNPLDAAGLAAALNGQEAVLSGLGSRGVGTTFVRSSGARATIEAMRRTGVRRLIIISSSLVDAEAGWLSVFLARTLVRHIASDQRAMEELVAQSGLDWTVVRPALLDNSPLTGRYAASPVGSDEPVSYARMSRADVACMMLDCVERGTYMKQVVRLGGMRA